MASRTTVKLAWQPLKIGSYVSSDLSALYIIEVSLLCECDIAFNDECLILTYDISSDLQS